MSINLGKPRKVATQASPRYAAHLALDGRQSISSVITPEIRSVPMIEFDGFAHVFETDSTKSNPRDKSKS